MMVEKICERLTNKIRKKDPEIDDERAEAIRYGLELIVGETPKIIVLFAIAFALKIGWLVIFAYFSMLPYKVVAGGFHLKTNIGCTIATLTMYYGIVILSKIIMFETIYYKYITIILLFILSVIMISKYAPADTINLPILRKKERNIKKVLSYAFVTIMLICVILIKDKTISNILLINVLVETLSITSLAYKITRNEYGYKTYAKEENV